MEWLKIDRYTLKSKEPSGYTVAKNTSEGKTIYEAYAPAQKGELFNLLAITDRAENAKKMCQAHANAMGAKNRTAP